VVRLLQGTIWELWDGFQGVLVLKGTGAVASDTAWRASLEADATCGPLATLQPMQGVTG
jgi:hypothetical protein